MRYAAPYTSTTLMFFMASLECVIVAICVNHDDKTAWSLNPIRAISVLYNVSIYGFTFHIYISKIKRILYKWKSIIQTIFYITLNIFRFKRFFLLSVVPINSKIRTERQTQNLNVKGHQNLYHEYVKLLITNNRQAILLDNLLL